MKFEIGEIVILTSTCDKYRHLQNSECIITEFAPEEDGMAYIVEFDGFTHECGRKLRAYEDGLRRKPKDDEISWDKIEEMTGWSPPKEKANAYN